MSDQRYVEIPGSKTHELPPLLLHGATHCATDLTSVMLEAEDMLASTDAGEEILERRKLDLALQLTPDVWPHASRASFVELLREKDVPTGGVALEKAVGLRLTFRQPPPIDCFSSQFLFYLNATVAGTAYHAWSQSPALFPPNRFHFDVLDVS